MGAMTSTILSVVSGVSGLMQGMQQQAAYKQQGENAIASATMAAKEQARVSFKEAQIEGDNAKQAERRQKLAYLSSGVSLEGSPLLIMEETRRKGAENVDEILKSGNAAAGAIMQEGYNTKTALNLKGRDAFSSGIGSALGSVAGVAQNWSKLK